MKDYDIHPDFLKYQNLAVPLNPIALPVMNFFLTRLLHRKVVPSGVVQARAVCQGYEGASVKLLVFSPVGIAEPLPALVYFHGGAFAIQASPQHKRLAMTYAVQTPCKVVFVDYRLLPGHPYPTGLEDCYAALQWTHQNAQQLGIDASRIAVGGDSAGGALAAGVCLLARDRKTPAPCFQLLIYPVTDARQCTPSVKHFDDTPLWNSKYNAKMWAMYLRNGHPEKRSYASPMEADSLKRLPPAYLEVAEYDCLRDEGIAYAEQLSADGVQVTLHRTERTVHGYDAIGENVIVRESIACRLAALRAALAKEKRFMQKNL